MRFTTLSCRVIRFKIRLTKIIQKLTKKGLKVLGTYFVKKFFFVAPTQGAVGEGVPFAHLAS